MFEKKNHETDIQFLIYILGNVTYYVIKKTILLASRGTFIRFQNTKT